MAEDFGEIREGDLVQLSSGGWKMTVVALEGEGAICVWHTGSLLQTAWVSFGCLVKSRDRAGRRRPSPVKEVE